MLRTALRYPFTGGGIALLAATLAGTLPFGGLLAVFVATSLTIPVGRASAGRGAEADVMPRLLPPPPGLGRDLAVGAAVHLLYLGPTLVVLSLAFLISDVPELEFLSPFLALPLLLQVVLFVAWPGAVALVVRHGNPLPAFSRYRVMRQAEELGGRFAGLVAYVLVCGGLLLVATDSLRSLGLGGRALASALVGWFWLTGLHLVGRALRGTQLE